MSTAASMKVLAAKSQPPSSSTHASLLLQRKCACGSPTSPLIGECAECKSRKRLQTKLTMGARNDPLEKEADRVADQVLAAPVNPAVPGTYPRIQGFAAKAGESAGAAPASIDQVLASSGRPLDSALRQDMGQRFGYDFSRVRVHSGAAAEQSARDVNALAYTIGRDIVFGAGRFAPGTPAGRRLLAHELTHVVQQSVSDEIRGGQSGEKRGLSPMSPTSAHLVQRDGMGDVRLAEACNELEEKIRATPAFAALDANKVRLTEEILTELRKRSLSDRLHFLSKLKLLFDTPLKPPATITTETQTRTTTAAKAEKTRLAKPAEAAKTTLEEKASASAKRAWVGIPGKFGGGTYYVDRTSPTNIVVKADVLLTPKGTGTKKDVDAIKGMEDAIEKAASTKGYVVDIRFVDAAAADTFKADVDPSKPEVATNWAGGDPLGFAHELHHMFAFELDRYDYTAHSTNESMEIPDRLHWFREELKKPPNYNDPNSIMNRAAHPSDDDACRVAGLNVATCVPARSAARAAKK